jgi:ABC-type transport system involved in multi-copper enzyme maturation permease subunit
MTVTTAPTTGTTRPRPARTATAATPLWRLTAVELRKMADTRAGAWLLAVIGLLATAVVVIRLFTGPAETRNLMEFFTLTLLPVGIVLPVLGILAMTSEWTQRTALTTYALVPRRGRVLAAKLLAVVAACAAAVVACLALAAVGNAVAAGMGGNDASWTITGSAIGYAVIFQLVGVGIGVAFGAALMNSALAIVLYFVLPTAWTIAGGMVPALQKPAGWFDTSRTSEALLSDHMTAESWARLATSVAVWVLLPLALGAFRLSRREVK